MLRSSLSPALIIAAALPAILYFATVWIGVNGYADRHGLKPYREDMRPALRAVIVTSLFFALPFAALLIVILGVLPAVLLQRTKPIGHDSQ